MTASGHERLSGAAARLMDRLDAYGEDAEVEVVVALASVRLPTGELRVEWITEPDDRELVLRALRPALASVELGIGDEWEYPPPDAGEGGSA